MKRRSFLKLLAGAAAAVAVGLELALPELAKPVVEVLVPPVPIYHGINPEWVTAPYEAQFLFGHQAYEHLKPFVDPYPMRFSKSAGEYVAMPMLAYTDEEINAMDEQSYLEWLREDVA